MINGDHDDDDEDEINEENETLVDVLHCILDSLEGIEAKLDVIMSIASKVNK